MDDEFAEEVDDGAEAEAEDETRYSLTVLGATHLAERRSNVSRRPRAGMHRSRADRARPH